MHEDATCNDLQKIITQAINEIKQEQGENFNLAKINLAATEGIEIRIGKECLFSSEIVFRTGASHSILDMDCNRINYQRILSLRIMFGSATVC